MFILRTTTVTECATANDFKILARLTINEWPEAKRKKFACRLTCSVIVLQSLERTSLFAVRNKAMNNQTIFFFITS